MVEFLMVATVNLIPVVFGAWIGWKVTGKFNQMRLRREQKEFNDKLLRL